MEYFKANKLVEDFLKGYKSESQGVQLAVLKLHLVLALAGSPEAVIEVLERGVVHEPL